MILLAEHAEPSLAAKKKRRHVALETATSTPKNRVWNFFGSPLGRTCSEPDLSAETAIGSVQYSYESASGQGYYYTSDHLGSTREMCNSTGAIVARYSYDPYGRVTLVSGSNLATVQYAGYYTHATSGLNLTWYRGYDPNTGKWLSRDPTGERGGINLFAYVAEDPVANRDPLGLATVTPGPHQTVNVQMENCEVVLITGHGAEWAVNRFIPPSTPGCGALGGQNTCGNGPSNEQIPPANKMQGLGTYDEENSADMAARVQTYAAVEAAIRQLCPCCKKVKFTVVWINKYGYETRTWNDWSNGQGTGTSSVMIDCKQPLKPQIERETW